MACHPRGAQETRLLSAEMKHVMLGVLLFLGLLHPQIRVVVSIPTARVREYMNLVCGSVNIFCL